MSFTGNLESCIRWLEEQPDGIYEVKRKRKRRTLTQNGYYWQMVGDVSDATGVPVEDIHAENIRRHAHHEVFTVLVEVPIEDYVPYFEVIGTGWMGGKLYKHVRIFRRSSEMDSAEFSRLIDGMREECANLGIPCMTREEIARLRFAEPGRKSDEEAG